MTNAHVAQAYYKAMADKNSDEMRKYLHADIQLISPLGKTIGREAVLQAATKLFPILKSIEIDAKFDVHDQAMLTYDMSFDGPVGILRAAALMTVKDGLIVSNELFFDARSFMR